MKDVDIWLSRCGNDYAADKHQMYQCQTSGILSVAQQLLSSEIRVIDQPMDSVVNDLRLNELA